MCIQIILTWMVVCVVSRFQRLLEVSDNLYWRAAAAKRFITVVVAEFYSYFQATKSSMSALRSESQHSVQLHPEELVLVYVRLRWDRSWKRRVIPCLRLISIMWTRNSGGSRHFPTGWQGCQTNLLSSKMLTPCRYTRLYTWTDLHKSRIYSVCTIRETLAQSNPR